MSPQYSDFKFARFSSTRERSNFIAVILSHRQRSSESCAPSTTVRSLRELQWSPSPASRWRKKVSDAASRHHRKPGNDGAELPCRDAIGIRVFLHACQESLPRTDGRPSPCFPRCLCSPKREAERRTAHQRLPRRNARAQPRPDKRTARLSALLRGHAPGTQLGLGRASWNHRMQTGGPSPAPVQRAPRSPARAGRADTQTACRLTATNSARRNRTRSVSRRHRLTSLTMNGMDAVIQIRARAVKGFSIYADKSRGCAERLPLCASVAAFHSTPKIRKSGVVPVNRGFPCCCKSLRGCAAAAELHNSP